MASMELNCRELKSRARKHMRASRPPFWLVTLIYLLLTTGISTAANLLDAAYISFSPSPEDTIPLFLTLLITLYTTVLEFGYQLWALKTYRQQQPGLGTLIDGFSMAGRVLILELIILVNTVAWSLLWSIPISLLVSLLIPYLSPFAVSLAYAILLQGLVHVVSYRYLLAPFLLMDRPEAGPFAAVRESVFQMRGWKGQFFRLDLTFLGWYVLNVCLALGVGMAFDLSAYLELLTMEFIDPVSVLWGPALPGIAVLLSSLIQVPISLWLLPYRAVSCAGFYQLRVQQRSPPPPVWESYDGSYDGADL